MEKQKSNEDLLRELETLKGVLEYFRTNYQEAVQEIERMKKNRDKVGPILRALKWYLSGFEGPGSREFWETDRRNTRITYKLRRGTWIKHKASDLYVWYWRRKFGFQPIDSPWNNVLR